MSFAIANAKQHIAFDARINAGNESFWPALAHKVKALWEEDGHTDVLSKSYFEFKRLKALAIVDNCGLIFYKVFAIFMAKSHQFG